MTIKRYDLLKRFDGEKISNQNVRTVRTVQSPTSSKDKRDKRVLEGLGVSESNHGSGVRRTYTRTDSLPLNEFQFGATALDHLLLFS